MKTKHCFKRNKGQLMVEYGVILSSVIVVLLLAGPTIRAFFGGYFFNKTSGIAENTAFVPGESSGNVTTITDQAWQHTKDGGAVTDNYATDNSTDNTNLSTPF